MDGVTIFFLVIFGLAVLILQIAMIVKFFEMTKDIRDLRNHFISNQPNSLNTQNQFIPNQQDDDNVYEKTGITSDSLGLKYHYAEEKDEEQGRAILSIQFLDGTKGKVFVYDGGTASFYHDSLERVYSSKDIAIESLYMLMVQGKLSKKGLIKIY